MVYPCSHTLAGLFGDLELYRSLRLLLHDHRPAGDVLSLANVAHAQFRQITSAKLAVDAEIEHCQPICRLGNGRAPITPAILCWKGPPWKHPFVAGYRSTPIAKHRQAPTVSRPWSRRTRHPAWVILFRQDDMHRVGHGDVLGARRHPIDA